jgi:hypothetical protein
MRLGSLLFVWYFTYVLVPMQSFHDPDNRRMGSQSVPLKGASGFDDR